MSWYALQRTKPYRQVLADRTDQGSSFGDSHVGIERISRMHGHSGNITTFSSCGGLRPQAYSIFSVGVGETVLTFTLQTIPARRDNP